MTQNQKATNPKGVCQKLCDIVNPFKSATHDDHTNMIPIGSDPHVTDSSRQKPEKTSRKKHTFERREIVVFNGQGNEQKIAHGVFEKAAPNEAKEVTRSVHFLVDKIHSKKDNDLMHEAHHEDDHDGKFSDYIIEVKKKIMRTLTRVNGGDHGAVRVPKRRDSFDDRVTNYIDRSRIKIRTTTNVGDENGFSPK